MIDYFSSIISKKTKRELGHNPASSGAAIIMFLLTFLLVITGLFMVNFYQKAFFEEVHEIAGYTFLVIVVLHILGVIFHQYQHQDGMALSRINGQKIEVAGKQGISNQKPLVLWLFLSLMIAFTFSLLINYDSKKGTLILLGNTLQLGEKEPEHSLDYYNNYYDLNEKEED